MVACSRRSRLSRRAIVARSTNTGTDDLARELEASSESHGNKLGRLAFTASRLP